MSISVQIYLSICTDKARQSNQQARHGPEKLEKSCQAFMLHQKQKSSDSRPLAQLSGRPIRFHHEGRTSGYMGEAATCKVRGARFPATPRRRGPTCAAESVLERQLSQKESRLFPCPPDPLSILPRSNHTESVIKPSNKKCQVCCRRTSLASPSLWHRNAINSP